MEKIIFYSFFNIFNIKTGIIFFYLKQIEMSVLLLFLHIWHWNFYLNRYFSI